MNKDILLRVLEKKLSGEDANNDNTLSSQLVHQLVSELEDVLSVLKKD